MALPAQLRSIGFVLGALAAALGAATPTSTAAIETARVQVQRASGTMLLTFCAGPEPVASIVRHASDPQRSSLASRSRGVRIVRGSGEFLRGRPEFLGSKSPRPSRAVWVGRGHADRHLAFQSFDDEALVRGSIRQVPSVPRRRVLAGRTLPHVHRPALGADYRRPGTITEDLGRVWVIDLANVIERPTISEIGLGELASAGPDLLILSNSAPKVFDERDARVHHAALHQMPRTSIAHGHAFCGGPAHLSAR